LAQEAKLCCLFTSFLVQAIFEKNLIYMLQAAIHIGAVFCRASQNSRKALLLYIL
jgi:hypothetical protein